MKAPKADKYERREIIEIVERMGDERLLTISEIIAALDTMLVQNEIAEHAQYVRDHT